ncbi:MAG: DUF2027 domain-containing protein [Bacteroidales bacterium]|nr:DUF2027 domain-containing protein [Bacteroidales bacterium]
MLRLNVGDKVKFLNELGGGTVKKLMDSRMVLIEIEDGFDIPVLMSELVLANPEVFSQPKRNSQVDILQKEIQQKAEQEAAEEDQARKGKLRRFGKNPETEGIYLAFLPHDQQWILTGLLDVVLLNHTPAEMLYSIGLKTETGLLNADFGQMEPYSKINIETISRNDINAWCEGIVQAILVFEQSAEVYHPLFSPFDIKPNRFYKEGSYVMSGVLGDKALMVCLQTLVALKSDGNYRQSLEFNTETTEPVRVIAKEKALIDKHRKDQGEAVIDLHIGELVTNISGLTSHDMFKIQFDYFEKTLHSAMENDYTKVTYIHGVGNGVLKNAIVKALESFEGTENNMAAMAKFGVGAIDVIIKQNERK